MLEEQNNESYLHTVNRLFPQRKGILLFSSCNMATANTLCRGIEFQMLAIFVLCSICSQTLDLCSLARAHKIFAIARMLRSSLKFARNLANPVWDVFLVQK